MSGYTIGEIFVWLLLAAILGFILGWLVRTSRYESEQGAEGRERQATPTTAVASSGASGAEPAASTPSAAAPAKNVARKKTAKKVASKRTAKKASAKKVAAAEAPAKKSTATKAPAKKSTATKAPAKKAAVATKAPAKKAAVATKAPAKKTSAKKAAAKKAVTPGRFPGSAKPLSGGRAPSADYTIKGNEDSMIFHTPDSPSYGQTIAETWFKTESAAVAAGFRKPLNA